MGLSDKDGIDQTLDERDEYANESRLRQQALSKLAGERVEIDAKQPVSVNSVEPPPSLLNGSHRRRSTWIALSSLTLVTLIIVSGIVLYPRVMGSPSSRKQTIVPAIPGQLMLALATDHLSCPIRASWAPDARRIAVVFVGQGCGKNPGQAGNEEIGIFDARTGELLRKIETHISYSTTANSVTYPSLIWSPDSKLLLLDISTTQSDGSVLPGLLIYPVDGSASRSAQAAPIRVNTLTGPTVIWDTRGWTAKEQTGPLPAALTYQWMADGQIAVSQPISIGPTLGYSGSPVEIAQSQTVSLWRSGAVTPLDAFDDTGASTPFLPPAGYAFTSSAALWSPDGTHLAMPLWFSARLAPIPGITTSPLAPASCADRCMPEACVGAPVPLADSALQAVVRDAATPATVRTANGTLSQYRSDSIPISWRPDGKELAVVRPTTVVSSDPTSGEATITIALYNTSSGQILTTLQLPTETTMGSPTPRFAAGPEWSPTGQQLAYVDSNYGQVVIWGSGQLP